jgi:hypothetical protein
VFLLVQVVVLVVVLTGLAGLLVRISHGRTSMPETVAKLVVMVAAVVALTAGTLSLVMMQRTASADEAAHLPRFAADTRGGVTPAFFSWARRRISSSPGPHTYYVTLAPDGTAAADLADLWAGYQLLPDRRVDRISAAQWVVLDHASPSVMVRVHAQFGPVERWGPYLEIARRRRGT